MKILNKTIEGMHKLTLYIKSLKEWGVIDYLKDPWKAHRGFQKEMVKLCGINSKNHKEFISDREHNSRWPFNAPYQGAVSDKLALIRILHQYKECMPKYFFLLISMAFFRYGIVPMPMTCLQG